VFSVFLNIVGSPVSRREFQAAGREFQAAGPANEKARSPNFVLSRGVTYDDDFADSSPERHELSATDRTQLLFKLTSDGTLRDCRALACSNKGGFEWHIGLLYHINHV
jgi:hypothetical protein